MMIRPRSLHDLESDLGALRASAERAGVALGCLFSSSAEYEAANVGDWRARASARLFGTALAALATGVLTLFF